MTQRDLDWWISVRDDPVFNDQTRRIGDVMYGYITVYEYPKTHKKLSDARWKSKRKKNDLHVRLSFAMKPDYKGCVRTQLYFNRKKRTVNSAVRWSFRMKRRHQVREYGRRGALILGPRADRFYRKYGPIGG